MKPFWDITEADANACLEATRWAAANLGYFRGGGFSSQFSTTGAMPVTMARLNMVEGIGPVLQIAEGYTVDLPDEVNKTLLDRTDPTWPSTWFAPILTGKARSPTCMPSWPTGAPTMGPGPTATWARISSPWPA